MSAWTRLKLGLKTPDVSRTDKEPAPVELNGNYMAPVMWFALFEQGDAIMRNLGDEDPIQAPAFRSRQSNALERLQNFSAAAKTDQYIWSALRPLELLEDAVRQQSADSWITMEADEFIEMGDDPGRLSQLIQSVPQKLMDFKARIENGQTAAACRILNDLADLSGLTLSGSFSADVQKAAEDAAQMKMSLPLEAHIFRTIGWPSWCRDPKIEERWRKWMADYRGQWEPDRTKISP